MTEQEYEKTYTVRLTEREMQTIANAIGAYFNHLTANKRVIPPAYAIVITEALQKFKAATEGKSVIVRVQ